MYLSGVGYGVKLVYEGHRVKVKVTGAKKVEILIVATPVLQNIAPRCLLVARGFRIWRI